jgi:hypothetical protein
MLNVKRLGFFGSLSASFRAAASLAMSSIIFHWFLGVPCCFYDVVQSMHLESEAKVTKG